MRAIVAGLSVVAAAIAAPRDASAQEPAPEPVSGDYAVSDPWEGVNRNLFAVHETVDEAVLEPVARGYRAVTPRPVRSGVSNFLRNLRAPVIFANDILQGEFSRAGATAARFGVNSTVGLLGVLDPAREIGIERHDEDFGQTLAVWGVEPGPYLFVPLLGPMNVRDGAGRIVDTAIDPLRYGEFNGDDAFRTSRTAVTALSARESVLDTIDNIRENSVDPYVSIRSSYNLFREAAVRNGRQDVQELPEFEEILDPDAATPESAPTEGTGEDAAETSSENTGTP